MTPTFLTYINGCTLQPLSEFRGDFVTHKMHTSIQSVIQIRRAEERSGVKT